MFLEGRFELIFFHEDVHGGDSRRRDNYFIGDFKKQEIEEEKLEDQKYSRFFI